MRKGFYEELDFLKEDFDDANFGFLENEIIDKNVCAFEFLHGFCDIFAYKLAEIFSYDLECIMDKNGLIHAYYKKELNGQIQFIDVRGITDNYEEFIEEFDDFLDYFGSPSYPICGTQNMLSLEEIKVSNEVCFNKFSEIAEKLILENKGFYTI